MSKRKAAIKEIKSKLHPRNKHRQRYDFSELISSCPDLKPFVGLNKFGNESIDFFNTEAVKMLNKALLIHFYEVAFWDIPANYLCPPVPSRADYIHYVADLLGSCNEGVIPKGAHIKCLDIGVGANCIYPIIGLNEYGWSFRGTDIDPMAIFSAKKIILNNPSFQGQIELKTQTNPQEVFYGIFDKKEKFDLTICNPPFHSSAAEAEAGTMRKLKNLTGKKVADVSSNFGGQPKELWCEGGEKQFIRNMIRESKKFAANCLWFSTLVSKEATLKKVYQQLKKSVATEIKTIEMKQGHKTSRIIAWTFLGQKRRDQWVEKRWDKNK